MRQAMGMAVFSGMIGVTLFGLFLTPVFYVTLMKLGWRKTQRARDHPRRPRWRRRRGGGLVDHRFAVDGRFRPSRPPHRGTGLSGAHQRPARPVQDGEPGNWKEGRPLDNVPKDAWWTLFADAN